MEIVLFAITDDVSSSQTADISFPLMFPSLCQFLNKMFTGF